MATRISAAEAARCFTELLNRVRANREEFIIESEGKAICRIAPEEARSFTVGDLIRVLETAPKPDPGYWDAVEEAVRNQPPMPENPRQR